MIATACLLILKNVTESTTHTSKSCNVQIGNMCGVTMIVVLVQSDPVLGAVDDPVSANGSGGSFSMRRALWGSLTALDYRIAE